MKAYLKKFGIWEIVINPPAPSNKKGKSATQKEAKKDNTTALNLICFSTLQIPLSVLSFD